MGVSRFHGLGTRTVVITIEVPLAADSNISDRRMDDLTKQIRIYARQSLPAWLDRPKARGEVEYIRDVQGREFGE